MSSKRSSFVDCTTPEDQKKSNDEIALSPGPAKTTGKAKKKKSKKAKKKNTILYQQTAIKYFDGFTKNKRFEKGISLSTGCAIFKTAWELPENNGLILPSRIIRHFKQVLPKKPKKEKNKKKSKKSTAATAITSTNSMQRESSLSLDAIPNAKHMQKSRTMMEIRVPASIQLMAKDILSGSRNSSLQPLEDTLIDLNNNDDEQQQKFDENNSSNKLMAHLSNNVRSKSTDLSGLSMQNDDVMMDKNIRFRDHAHIIEDDLKADVEEQPVIKKRSQTDAKQIDIDLISFKCVAYSIQILSVFHVYTLCAKERIYC